MAEGGHQVFNILPLHDLLIDDAAMNFPHVRAAMEALRNVEKDGLALPPNFAWREGMDMLDWLGAFFGFQVDNVKNQREHVVLLLANYQMRLELPPDKIDRSVVQLLRKKLLKNYRKWCSYLCRKPNFWFAQDHRTIDDLKHYHRWSYFLRLSKDSGTIDHRRELMYSCLYLLIWGEAANLRFMPECLCYIFHNMVRELNIIIDRHLLANSTQNIMPASFGENGFLRAVVTPIYDAVRAEAAASIDGKAPPSVWRNYDDMNEYFWSKRCFKQLGWPLKASSNYLVTRPTASGQKVGKTGFVEQRSFWNIFRSFDHLWIGLILMLQAMMILAFNGDGIPWNVLHDRDVQGSVLSVFITWAGLRLLLALLDAGMQYSLISRETKLVALRLTLKVVVALSWTITFSILFARIWVLRTKARGWSREANLSMVQFVETACVFLLPEALAILLFILPWVRNFVETTEWTLFHALTWWFQTRLFVARGLREGIIDNIKYTFFWLSMLLAKFSFSYFLQIKPLVAPTQSLLKLNVVRYEWHEFFTNHNRFIVIVLWAPVVCIYLMDLQIWYSIFSSFVGVALGLISHLGEIRNVEQLRLRFPFFASAITFNLMPTARLPREQACNTWALRCKDMVRRVQLRYGLGQAYEKFESNMLESRKFACIWNEIISSFRDEDLVSDQEVELLEIPRSSWNNDQEVELSEIQWGASRGSDQEVQLLQASWNKDGSWNKDVVQWPSVLLSNELLIALSIAQRWQGDDDSGLWRKISRNEYRKCAVVECYASLRHLLGRILTKGSNENSLVENMFAVIEEDLKGGAFTRKYRVGELVEVHTRVLALVEILLTKPSSKDVQIVVVALQNLYDAVRDLSTSKHCWEFPRDAGMTGDREHLLFVNAVELPDEGNRKFFRSLRRFRTTLSTRESMNNVPMNLEARRRIAFFSNSLFMRMPHAPSVERMLAFSVLTPYYREEVLYSDAQLNSPNEDGITILYYLQSIYPDEWRNFLERTERQRFRDPEANQALEARLWASFRGQTLSRTVRGMMYYPFALERLAYLDAASEQELQQAVQMESLDGRRSSDLSQSRRSLSSSMSGLSGLNRTSQEKATALLKFTYVIACQIYGVQKAKRDPRAEDILFLMKRHPAVRVAYVDVVKSVGGEEQYFSVLVKYDQDLKREVEIYRIRLPGPFKLGEGKPENQNHALIFTRGDAVQTIDMNQDNYFEEALKVRNLLQEFTCYYGLRRPQILGVRENVFTGSVSSLASFMSAQETVFVTLGQRVLANPLKIRMHYGHPDVFDRLWFLSRGGLSKASRVINISEDIFAGFNCTMREGNVTHHEYIQVGKGRDVGLNQIALFEAKVAGGNGEQILSRDVYRLGHRLDFFRMLSFYYTTVGFYISNMLTVLTVYAFLWGRVYLALSGLEKAIAGDLTNSALTAAINQQFIVQLGLFTALPMVVENSLEQGFSTSVWSFLTMQLQLCSVFFTFSLGTKCHYFGRTLLHGGAKYQATGRGFVVRHEKFAENYRLYARSHFVKGVELMILLIIYEAYGGPITNTTVYILLTFSSWFLVFSWIMGPFLFNPSGFDWLQTVYDFEDFQNWIWYKGGALIKSDQSWEVWWNEEQDHLRTTNIWGKLLEVVLSLRFFLIQYGMVYRLHIAAHNKSIVVYLVSWFYVIVSTMVVLLVARAGEKWSAKEHLYYRAIQSLVALAILLVLVLLFELTRINIVDLFLSFIVFIPTGWGLLSIACVVKPVLLHTSIWPCVISVARLYELAIGIIVMTPLAMLSWLPGFQAMQTRILFNQAFSRGLQISRILAGKKPNQGF